MSDTERTSTEEQDTRAFIQLGLGVTAALPVFVVVLSVLFCVWKTDVVTLTEATPEILVGLLIVMAIDVIFKPLVSPSGAPALEGLVQKARTQQLVFVLTVVGLAGLALCWYVAAVLFDPSVTHWPTRIGAALTSVSVLGGVVLIGGSAYLRLEKILGPGKGPNDGQRGGNGNPGGGGDDPGSGDGSDPADAATSEVETPESQGGSEAGADPSPEPVPEPAKVPKTRRAPQADLVATTLKKTKSSKKADKKKPKKSGKKQSKQKDKKKKK